MDAAAQPCLRSAMTTTPLDRAKLTYFDFSGSRGEDCRLALHVAGVPFEDHRIGRDAWLEMKPTSPFGSLPILETSGHPPLAQTNAILQFVGRLYDLHPSDPFEAARHEAIMAHVEDLRGKVGPMLRISEPEAKKAARTELRESFLPTWAGFAEKAITKTPYFGGDAIQVADIKLYMAVRWFESGVVDDIPATIFHEYPKLMAIYAAVHEHPRVTDWRTKH